MQDPWVIHRKRQTREAAALYCSESSLYVKANANVILLMNIWGWVCVCDGWCVSCVRAPLFAAVVNLPYLTSQSPLFASLIAFAINSYVAYPAFTLIEVCMCLGSCITYVHQSTAALYENPNSSVCAAQKTPFVCSFFGRMVGYSCPSLHRLLFCVFGLVFLSFLQTSFLDMVKVHSSIYISSVLYILM